jgi:hypothetical protein
MEKITELFYDYKWSKYNKLSNSNIKYTFISSEYSRSFFTIIDNGDNIKISFPLKHTQKYNYTVYFEHSFEKLYDYIREILDYLDCLES